MLLARFIFVLFCATSLLAVLHYGVASGCCLDLEELRHVSYRLDILDRPLCLDHDKNHPLATSDHDLGHVILSSKYGQSYQCSYEMLLVNGDDRREDSDDSSVGNDVVTLLSEMTKTNCLVKTFDWWTYEFCYGQDVKQYHTLNGHAVGEIISLGRFLSDFDWTGADVNTSDEFVQRYHSQAYVNGTVCDLTGEARSAVVKFVCSEGEASSVDEIVDVTEPATCSYSLTIHTRKTCSLPHLRIQNLKRTTSITCQPLLRLDEYEQFLANEKALQSKSEAESEHVSSVEADVNGATTSEQQTSSSQIRDDDAMRKRELFKKYVVESYINGVRENLEADDIVPSNKDSRLNSANTETDNKDHDVGISDIEKAVGDLVRDLDELSSVDETELGQAASDKDSLLDTRPVDDRTRSPVIREESTSNEQSVDATVDRAAVDDGNVLTPIIVIDSIEPVDETLLSSSDVQNNGLESVNNDPISAVDKQSVVEDSVRSDAAAGDRFSSPVESETGDNVVAAKSIQVSDSNTVELFPASKPGEQQGEHVMKAESSSNEEGNGGSEAADVEDDEEPEEVEIVHITKTDDTEQGRAEIGDSYITWQGRGNQIQQITITGSSVKVRSKQSKTESHADTDASNAVGPTAQEQVAKDIITTPTRKTEVRVVNVDYYNQDGKPVGAKLVDGRERPIVSIFKKNDDEIEEHRRHHRLLDNYSVKWSDGKMEKKKSS